MNRIPEILAMLQQEKQQLEQALATLEQLWSARGEPGTIGRVRSTRGRKSMGPAERLEVSARMKRYWASRRSTQ
jgi:hypothetical protein